MDNDLFATDEMPDSFRYLRDEVTVESQSDALPFLASAARLGRPGSAVLVMLGPGRRFHDVLVVEDGAPDLVDLVELVCHAADPDAEALFIAVDRTGEVPVDRPDDELLWMELREVAEHGGRELLDWFVLWGSTAFSVAEFAPAPAGWRDDT